MFLFFKKHCLGLSISDYSIEIALLSDLIGNPQLLAVNRTILEPGIVVNGQIQDKEKLKEVINGIFKSPNFKNSDFKNLIFSLPEEQSFVFNFSLPEKLNKKEKVEYIKSQMAQNLPFSLKDVKFDFQIKNNEIFLVAASKKVIEEFLELFEECGISSPIIETESESLSRVLINNKKEVTLIIDIGAKTTSFSIFDENGLRLSISNKIAGEKFTQNLAEGLKISFKEAEKIKKESGLNPEIDEGKVFLIFQKDIQVGIIWEARKIEDYFLEKEKKEIDRIILSGGSASLPYLKEYLSSNLDKKVEIGDIWSKIKGVKVKSEELKEGLLFYQNCIGAALRGLGSNPQNSGINLTKKSMDFGI